MLSSRGEGYRRRRADALSRLLRTAIFSRRLAILSGLRWHKLFLCTILTKMAKSVNPFHAAGLFKEYENSSTTYNMMKLSAIS